MLFDRIGKKDGKGVKVMAESNVTHLVLVYAPGLVRFNLTLIEHRYGFVLEEIQRTSKAGFDSLVAGWVFPVLVLGSSKELLRRITELADHDFVRGRPAVL